MMRYFKLRSREAFGILASLCLLIFHGTTLAQSRADDLKSSLPPQVLSTLGIASQMEKLSSLHDSDSDSPEVTALRVQILAAVLRGSFEIDSTLGRIEHEVSYLEQDQARLRVRSARRTTALNVATFALSGALGAAGASMQLTNGLNHAGTALLSASGGAALGLSALQLRDRGSAGPIDSPYAMLAEILGQPVNAASAYPPIVSAYLFNPRDEGQPTLAASLQDAWVHLERVKTNGDGAGAPVKLLAADDKYTAKLEEDDIEVRLFLLHDLSTHLQLFRSQLAQYLEEKSDKR